jgi:hypothetical protein
MGAFNYTEKENVSAALLPGIAFACRKKRHTALPHERQQVFHFSHHFFPLPLVRFGRFPMARTPLVFGFASELDCKVQLGPDVLCEFRKFKTSVVILRPVQNGRRFGHNAHCTSLRINGRGTLQCFWLGFAARSFAITALPEG